ncbi:MAG: hypothetical protein WDZ27_00655 [Waddliaceae bacterium]
MKPILFLSLFLCFAKLNALYTSPGLLFEKNGEWVGTDHLYRIPTQMTVNTEIIKSADLELPINEEIINSWLLESLKGAKIESPSGQMPDTPILQALVMIQIIPNGYVAYMELRLFEFVDIKRTTLDPSTRYQAITWENQILIPFPASELENQIKQNIESLASTFITRYNLVN